jgi:triosephosphate isomerase
MARKLIIAGNWKMNHGAGKTREIVCGLRAELADVMAVDIVVCPPFTSLAAAVEAAAGSNIVVAAQNLNWAENGAFTGEISAAMLTELPVTYVIIGHSERRHYFGETDETVNQRLRAALDAGLIPIVCVGETQHEREAGETEAVVGRQLDGGLAGLNTAEVTGTVIAYEPVWAIGTGLTATPDQAQAVHAFIRNRIRAAHGADAADQVRIQYGGSVKVDNAAELMSQADIDGALVGGASLKVDDFAALVRNAAAG